MPKHFSSPPLEVQPYNPEALPNDQYEHIANFDAEKLRHSSEENPVSFTSLGVSHIYDFRHFEWYSRGNLYNENTKPPHIALNKENYRTLNEKGELHSYNGQPSAINVLNYSFGMEWQKDGVFYRENGLPSIIETDYIAWRIGAHLHNLVGFAEQEIDREDREVLQNWWLYGIEVSEDDFNSITSYAKSAQLPVWTSMLLFFEIIPRESLQLFLNENKEWAADVPLSWIFKCLNIDDGLFKQNLLKSNKEIDTFSTRYRTGEDSFFNVFMKIVSIENNCSLT